RFGRIAEPPRGGATRSRGAAHATAAADRLPGRTRSPGPADERGRRAAPWPDRPSRGRARSRAAAALPELRRDRVSATRSGIWNAEAGAGVSLLRRMGAPRAGRRAHSRGLSGRPRSRWTLLPEDDVEDRA